MLGCLLLWICYKNLCFLLWFCYKFCKIYFGFVTRNCDFYFGFVTKRRKSLVLSQEIYIFALIKSETCASLVD